MSLEHAQQFVSRMKEDGDFRATVRNIDNSEVLNDYLGAHGYEFDQRELVAAMAACMAELDDRMQC